MIRFSSLTHNYFKSLTMKNFRRFLCFIAVIASCAIMLPAHAQTRAVNGVVNEGNTLQIGGYNLIPSDSLQVTDSIAYLISVIHQHQVDPYLTWEWQKIGSGTASITLNFFQSNDNVNWFPVPVGVAHASYSKTYTLSATTFSQIDFAADSARYSGKYLKLQYFTSSTASVKGKLYGVLKVNIR